MATDDRPVVADETGPVTNRHAVTDGPGHEELLSLLDRVSDAVLTVGADWRVRYANRAASAWLADRGRLPGRTLRELAPQLRDSIFEHACTQAVAAGEPHHVEDYAAGLGAWLQMDAYPEADRLLIFFRDCTQRRRQELATSIVAQVASVAEASSGATQALADAAEALRALTGYEVGKVWMTDHFAEAHLVACHHVDRPELAEFAATVQQAGLVPDSLAARALESGQPLVIEDLSRHVDATRSEAVRAAGLRAGVYLPLRWPDGIRAVIGLLTTTGPRHDDWCAVLAHAHPRLSALAQRLRTRQELDQLFNVAGEGLCISTADGWFHRVNPAMTRLLGRDAEELLSRPVVDFAHPDDRAEVQAAAERTFAGTRTPFECRVALPTGRERILSWTSRAVPEEGLVYSAARDVTADRRRERFAAEQHALLRSIALGAPLEETLDRLVRAAEAWLPGSCGSVWVAGHDHERFRIVAAPSFPARTSSRRSRCP